MLNISETDDTSGAAIVGGFVDCLKNGGRGSRKADTFVPNPPPYDYDKTKIDVFDSSPNALNFHATKYRKNQNSPCMGNTPSPDAVIQDAELVLPAFYALCPGMKSKSKKALLDTGTTKADNVFLFLSHVQQIAEKKIEDDISSPSRVEELKDSSTEEYLLEFVKVNKSAHLLTVASDQANKMKAIHTLMKEFADKETEHQYERDFERPDYLVKTTSYCEGDFMYCSDDEEDDD